MKTPNPVYWITCLFVTTIPTFAQGYACPNPVDDSFENNDTCATATPIGDGVYTNLFVDFIDKDYFSFCVANGATVDCTATFAAFEGDVDIILQDAAAVECGIAKGSNFLALGVTALSPETLSWTNSTGADLDVILEVSVWDGSGLDLCNNYDLIISGANTCTGSAGVPFCNPMDPNSTGASTTLRGEFEGTPGTGLTLTATAGPPGQFGYFLVGSGISEPGMPLGQGRFCLDQSLASSFGRYNFGGTDRDSVGQFNEGGVLLNSVGTATNGQGFDVPFQLPIAGNPVIAAGQTWHFQAWHRDQSGQSNFSNGLSVAF